MADEAIQRLRREAERSGPAPLLLGLCNPDDGDLLRRAGPAAQADLRDMLDYIAGQERWTITRVEVESVRHRKTTVHFVDEAGAARWHYFKRWARADCSQKRDDNDFYGQFLAALVLQGADPVLTETWVGKILLVRGERFGIDEFVPATFAEYLAAKRARSFDDPDPTWPPAPADAFAARSA